MKSDLKKQLVVVTEKEINDVRIQHLTAIRAAIDVARKQRLENLQHAIKDFFVMDTAKGKNLDNLASLVNFGSGFERKVYFKFWIFSIKESNKKFRQRVVDKMRSC